jgi:hypothetical protein
VCTHAARKADLQKHVSENTSRRMTGISSTTRGYSASFMHPWLAPVNYTFPRSSFFYESRLHHCSRALPAKGRQNRNGQIAHSKFHMFEVSPMRSLPRHFLASDPRTLACIDKSAKSSVETHIWNNKNSKISKSSIWPLLASALPA